jgi:hypothetical protein
VTERGPAPVGPVRPDEPIEWRIALHGVALTVGLGLVFVGGAGWWLGAPGLAGAGMAVAVVAGMQALSGALLSLAARFGPSALLAAALGGYVLKLCIYVVLMVLLRDAEGIDGPSLAVTAAVLLIVVLAWQTRLVLRDQRLFWVADPMPRAGPPDGRVVYTTGRPLPPPAPDPRSTERNSA